VHFFRDRVARHVQRNMDVIRRRRVEAAAAAGGSDKAPSGSSRLTSAATDRKKDIKRTR